MKMLTSKGAITKDVAHPGHIGFRWHALWCCHQGGVICNEDNAVLDRDELHKFCMDFM